MYARIEVPATADEKRVLETLSESDVHAPELAGEPIQAVLTVASGDRQRIGGIKVTAASGWFAARPSGTENIYKIYAESFRGAAHLHQIQAEARTIVTDALARRAGAPAVSRDRL